MIDWGSVAANGLWILGLVVILTVFSYAGWLASLRRVRRRDVLDGAGFQAFLCAGMILICLGLLFTSHRWWEHVLWGLVAALLAGQGYLAWQGRRGQGDSVDGD